MIKKISIVFLVLFFFLSGWYLFVKPNDFEVVIYAKTNPGTIYQSVINWNKSLNKGNTVTTTTSHKTSFHTIVNTYDFESYRLRFDWDISKINDSITKVTIGINDTQNAVGTRIKKVIGVSPLAELIDQEFSGFNETLTKYINQFTISVDGKEDSKETYAAYVRVSCHQDQKANHMINNSTYIYSFLKNHNIKLQSNPLLEIIDWHKDSGKLEFNFCFPISEQVNFPFHDQIKYKKVTAKKSLKATYRGNYSYTDNAWYALYQYAKKNHIKTSKTITEVFHNNPHTEGKDADWKATIYMEIEHD